MSLKGNTYNTSDSELVSDSEPASESEKLVDGKLERKRKTFGGKAPRRSRGRVNIHNTLTRDSSTGVDPELEPQSQSKRNEPAPQKSEALLLGLDSMANKVKPPGSRQAPQTSATNAISEGMTSGTVHSQQFDEEKYEDEIDLWIRQLVDLKGCVQDMKTCLDKLNEKRAEIKKEIKGLEDRINNCQTNILEIVGAAEVTEDRMLDVRNDDEIAEGGQKRRKSAPLGKDKFRLFKIKQHFNGIELEVKTFKIYRAPKYEAISYCWADKSDGTELVQCNDEPLEVWANLYAALRRLHEQDAEVWYWNDAICIEQGGEEVAVTEKLRQIAFMETIFRLADLVKVCLGEASNAEEQVFQRIVDTCEAAANKDVPRTDTALPGPKDEIWRYWAQKLLRSWFTRLWTTWATFYETIQRTHQVPWMDEPLEYEILEAQAQLAVDRDFRAECGVTLDAYQKASYGRNDAVKSCLYRNFYHIGELMFLERYHDTEFGYLQQVLNVFGNRKCSYDQDRPNAMRGLLTDRLKKGLKSYSTDADVATVYREVTRLWLTNDPTLSLLQRIRPLKQFLPERDSTNGTKLSNPSWVIDLGRVATEALAAGIPNRVDGFHAGLIRSTSLLGKQEWKVPDTDVLSKVKGMKHVVFPTDSECYVSGVQLGVVKSVVHSDCRGRTLDPVRSDVPLEYYADLQRWVSQSLDLIKCGGSAAEASEEIHWRTLVINHTDTKVPEVVTMFDVESKHSHREAYVGFSKTLRSDRPQLLREANQPTKGYYSMVFFYERVFPNWFCTSAAYVGRSYAVPKIGDVAPVFYGAATPFLLRPVPGQETFQFMCEAYCHGAMQGEALLTKNRARQQKRVFKLV